MFRKFCCLSTIIVDVGIFRIIFAGVRGMPGLFTCITSKSVVIYKDSEIGVIESNNN
jgi:hypothetical protein